MRSIQLDRFLRKEMDRNCISRERVQNQDVKTQRFLMAQGEARIARHYLEMGFGFALVKEEPFSDIDYLPIEFVDPVSIAGSPVRGERSRTKPDDAYSRRTGEALPEHNAYARFRT